MPYILPQRIPEGPCANSGYGVIGEFHPHEQGAFPILIVM